MNIKTVGIIGVGNVGSTIAYTLSKKNICDKILLKDLRTDFIQAMSLDISQAAISNGSKTITKAILNSNDFKDCNIVIITAGIARNPSMSREDLLIKNSNILKNILDEVFINNKNAIYIIVSNPLDEMVYFTLKHTKLPKNRVIGMAGELDSARFKYYINEALGFKASNIVADVIGTHSNLMTPLVSSATVDNKAISTILSKKMVEDIVEKTKLGGANIINFLKTGSAYFAPASASVNLCEAILTNSRKRYICSVLLEGEYNFRDITFGVPIILGKNGVEKILEININDEEEKNLKKSAISISKNIEILNKNSNFN